MTPHIIIAYAADARVFANIAARRLRRLKAKVERRSLDSLRGAAPKADRVIVLWSRQATNMAALLKCVQREDTIRFARVGQNSPRRGAPAIVERLPRARDNDEAWMAWTGFAAPAPGAATSKLEGRSSSGSRWEGLMAGALMGLVVAGAFYVFSPAFAGSIDAVVASIANELKLAAF